MKMKMKSMNLLLLFMFYFTEIFLVGFGMKNEENDADVADLMPTDDSPLVVGMEMEAPPFEIPECGICYENFPMTMRGECEHSDSFCAPCMVQIILHAHEEKTGAKCPACRVSLPKLFWNMKTKI
jgi:hypothetical protein